jgi:hypothetical protein
MSKWLIFLAVFLIYLPATAVGKNSDANNPAESGKHDCRYTINQGLETDCAVPKHEDGKTTVTVNLAPEARACYSWRAVLFSTRSPYVEILAVDDLNSVPHTFTVDEVNLQNSVITNGQSTTEERCKNLASISFEFPKDVKWVRLFADTPTEYLAPLADVSRPSPNSAKVPSIVKHWNSIAGAPGATAIQASWSPSFNGPQKLGVYWNLHYLENIRGKNQWLGISSFLDIDNRGQQNPDSAINTITYVAFLTQKDLWDYCAEQKDPCKDSYLYGFKIRPLTLTLRSGAEYALASDVLNQISTASLQATFVWRKIANQESPITFTPLVGIEGGVNIGNRAIAPSADNVFRWLAGADASYRFRIPKASWLLESKPFTLIGTFRARRPTTDEVFTTVSSGGTLETPDKRTRVYARSELSFPLMKFFSLSVLYQYGDLPPAFRFFGHTIGLSVKANSPSDYEH